VSAGEPASRAEDLVERYEELRRRALGAGTADGWRLGLAVLERQGLAAWIHAWDDVAPAPVPARSTPAPAGCEQVVAVLASMALACAAGG
jgi:hypothetical protein